MASAAHTANGKKTAANTASFFAIVLVWVLIDQFSKSRFVEMAPGGVLAGPFAGIFDIRLVHNTGGAWGIFAGNTTALGVFSLVVCAVLAAYFFWQRGEINALQTVGIALIVAGGVGNAIDRFTLGYVTDFIEFSFIDFPVFNIADIGVTCGFALLFIGLLLSFKSDGEDAS